MKLFLISVLVAGIPPWVLSAVACPEHDKKVVKSKVVVVGDKVGKVKAAPCIIKGKGDAAHVFTVPGKAPCIITADGKGAGVYTVAIGAGDEDGRSEPNLVWVSEKKGGKERGWLGVSIGNVPEALAAQLDIEGAGILVLNVVDDSPADRAGFKVHDVILSVDGDDVEGETGRAIDLVKSHKPGEEVDIVILREGREKVLTVELGSRPDKRRVTLKFPGGPSAEIEDRIRTKGMMMRKDDEGNWVIEDLGEIEKLKDLPESIRMFVPKSGSHSTQVYVHEGRKKIKTKAEHDGSVIAITQEGDGPITVARIEEGGRETEIEYDDEDELEEADEEAYELWKDAAGNVVIHMNIDGIGAPHIEIPDIEIPDFEFDFDSEEWQEHMGEWQTHMEEWGEQYGEHMEQWGEEFGEQMKEWGEHWAEMAEHFEEGGELPEGAKVPHLPMFFGKDGRTGVPGMAHLRHLSKPKHTFEVQTDGTIEVRIRKGDSELVQLYEDEDHLARRAPGLYEKYEKLMGLEDE